MAVTNGSNTTAVVYGTDLILLVEDPAAAGNWQPVAHATSHSIEITRDAREVSSKSTGEWKNNEYAKISWSGSVDALVSFDANIINYATLVAKQIARTKIKIISVLNDPTILKPAITGAGTPLDDADDEYIIDDDKFKLGSPTYSAEAIITSVSLNAGEAENATFSLSFAGATPLVAGTVAAAL